MRSGGCRHGRRSAGRSRAGCRSHLWRRVRTLVVWTRTSIRTLCFAGTVFNILVILSITVSITRVVIVATVVDTLPVDQIVLILTADVVRIFLIVFARAKVIRTVFTRFTMVQTLNFKGSKNFEKLNLFDQ